MGGWLGTLIGVEADIMYLSCPGKGTNDDNAATGFGPGFLIMVIIFLALCLMTCFLGRFVFLSAGLAQENNEAVVLA